MLAISTTRLSRAQTALANEPLGDRRGVLQHRVGERGEVDVVAEELLGRHRLGDLHQRAVRAEDQIERVGRLGLGELLGGEQRVGQRRVAQRQDGLQARLAPQERHRSQSMLTRRLAQKASRYQAIVLLEPSSSVNSGCQPSSCARLVGAQVLVPDLVASPRSARRAPGPSPSVARISLDQLQHGDLASRWRS